MGDATLSQLEHQFESKIPKGDISDAELSMLSKEFSLWLLRNNKVKLKETEEGEQVQVPTSAVEQNMSTSLKPLRYSKDGKRA